MKQSPLYSFHWSVSSSLLMSLFLLYFFLSKSVISAAGGHSLKIRFPIFSYQTALQETKFDIFQDTCTQRCLALFKKVLDLLVAGTVTAANVSILSRRHKFVHIVYMAKLSFTVGHVLDALN